MQVEHVAGVCLATWGTTKEQRDFAVGDGVFREVVVHHERVAAAVAEVLTDGAGRVRADVEERRRVRGASRNDDGVAHRVGFLKGAHDLCDGRLLLTDRVVDADDAGVLLVEDRVDRHRGLAGLAVADDQLALASADRHHRVDGLEAGLERFLHALTVDDAWRQSLDGRELLGVDRALAVDRLAERVDHTAEHLFTDGHRDDATRALDRVAFLDVREVAEEHRADAFLFEVQCDTEHAVRELDHLAGHGVLDPVDARDAVTDRNNATDFSHVDVDGIAADLVADDLGNLFGFDVH